MQKRRIWAGLDGLVFLPAGLVLASVFLGGCGSGKSAVRPDDLSVEQHRDEARKENKAADSHAKQWNPRAAEPSPFRNPIDSAGDQYAFPVPVYNPTDKHLDEVDRHRAHARQHEAAAHALETFEQAECKDFPPTTRASCPLLGPAQGVEDIDGGVRIHMLPTVRVDAVVAHMKCHFAYARSHGFDDATNCPLYLPNLDIRRGADPATVDITVADKSRIADLRRHAHEEVVVSARPR
jgi:hypothetical protein